jgi:hypothetical protein
MVLPIATGSRLPIKKLFQVKSGKSADVFPIADQNELGAPAFMNRPMDIK